MNTVLTKEVKSQSPLVGTIESATIEAVIISGPRKGEIVTLGDDIEMQLTHSEEAALDALVEAARRMAGSAESAGETAKSLAYELQEVNRKLHECV